MMHRPVDQYNLSWAVSNDQISLVNKGTAGILIIQPGSQTIDCSHKTHG